MKTFLAIYTGNRESFAAWQALSETQQRERSARGMKAWGEWAAKHSEQIVDQGAPLGKTKRVTAGGTADFRNAMAAYVIVRAETHEAAAQMFASHPHFSFFPGDGVEIMECLPLPG